MKENDGCIKEKCSLWNKGYKECMYWWNNEELTIEIPYKNCEVYQGGQKEIKAIQ